MRQPTIRPGLLIAGMTAFVLLWAAYCLAQDKAPPPAKKAPTAKQAFKNIQVLTDLPADQLLPTMHQWSANLGVGCDFCHVVETNAAGQHIGFERDDKPTKQIARQMLRMTRDINARHKIVGGQVTCYTCHHGRPEPEKAPPPRPEGTPPAR